MKAKLTIQAVKSLQPIGDRFTLWDSEVKGFGIRVNKDGTKTYILKYLFNGKQRWFTIGKHGSPYTPDAARTEALKLIGLAKSKVDPGEQKKKDRAAGITVGELCDNYLIAAEAGRLLTKFDTSKKTSTLTTDRGRIERHIKPLLGKKLVQGITRETIEKFLHDVAQGKTKTNVKTAKHGRAIVRGGRGTATRTVGLLGGIFTFAVKQRMRADNPVHGVQRYKDAKKERFLSGVELQRLGQVLSHAETAWEGYQAELEKWQLKIRKGPRPKKPAEAENPIAIAAIRLLTLTGCRKSEILRLKWEWIDLYYGHIRFPDSKTGAKMLHLNKATIDVLTSLPRLNNNPYVLPGEKTGSHLVGLPRIWIRIRKKAQLDDVRLHDLRHSFASVGASSGDSLLVLGKLLGHRDPQITQRYAHLSNDPVRDATNRIGQIISDALNGTGLATKKGAVLDN